MKEKIIIKIKLSAESLVGFWAHDSRLYQIEKGVRSKKVTVEERVNGSMLITLNYVRLPFREITVRPEKLKAPIHAPRYKKHIPSADHPWNKWNSQLFKSLKECGGGPKSR